MSLSFQRRIEPLPLLLPLLSMTSQKLKTLYFYFMHKNTSKNSKRHFCFESEYFSEMVMVTGHRGTVADLRSLR